MADPQSSVYHGFEQGPIRPPSEAHSLLVRVTRNCPWNRCTFCPVYKGTRFSRRPVDHVLRDVDAVHAHVEALRALADDRGRIRRADLQQAAGRVEPQDWPAFVAAANWFVGGMTSVFLQDANSLIVKPADLVAILEHLRARFPWVERVTSYARSHTLARMKDADLRAIREAGLNRIHVGLESGSNQVLAMVNKGATSETHVTASLKVKNAGMELSEYVMPGLGGRHLSQEHARQTAAVLNRIDPDFIRLRALAIPDQAPLSQDHAAGRFVPCTDREIAEELLLFVQHLEGTGVVQSDHILNLFGDLEGTLPEDKARMAAIPRAFLALPPARQRLYQVGRRLGIFVGLGDMDDPYRLAHAEGAVRELGITADNVDAATGELMKRFI